MAGKSRIKAATASQRTLQTLPQPSTEADGSCSDSFWLSASDALDATPAFVADMFSGVFMSTASVGMAPVSFLLNSTTPAMTAASQAQTLAG